jgi:hypothetical protein
VTSNHGEEFFEHGSLDHATPPRSLRPAGNDGIEEIFRDNLEGLSARGPRAR